MRVMEVFLFEVLDYNLNRKKAVSKKLEAAERDFTFKTEIKQGNLVLIFSAATYVEFKIITKTIINNSGLPSLLLPVHFFFW
jgi:hypothetical protein